MRKTHYIKKRGSVAMRLKTVKKAAVILAAVMLAGCADVPQNVKDRNEELESLREVQSSQADDTAS